MPAIFKQKFTSYPHKSTVFTCAHSANHISYAYCEFFTRMTWLTLLIILDAFFACQNQIYRKTMNGTVWFSPWSVVCIDIALIYSILAGTCKSNISHRGYKSWLDYCNFTQQALPSFGYKQHAHTLVSTCTDHISFIPAAYKGLSRQGWPCHSWKSLTCVSLGSV